MSCHDFARTATGLATALVLSTRPLDEFSSPAMRGCHVRSGRRQSMPSSSIDSCAALSETLPVSACGQMNRPRSRRLVSRHMPSPSLHSSLTRSPRRPRKANTLFSVNQDEKSAAIKVRRMAGVGAWRA